MWFRSAPATPEPADPAHFPAPVSDQAKPRRGGPKARTLVKLTAGLVLTLLVIFGGGFWLSGGTIVSPGDFTTEPPRLRNQSEKIYMLELINEARAEAGVPPVVMGTNPIAQIHAENLLRDCTLSHWGVDGLKPYMRYSLAGGYQMNKENLTTSNECDLLYTWLQWNDAPDEMVREAVQSLLLSPTHEETMLNPAFHQVSLGLAWDWHVFKSVQVFEGDHVELTELPVIADGKLNFAGRFKEDHNFLGAESANIHIFYDPRPQTLTQGQLVRTSCYSLGKMIAKIQTPSTFFVSDTDFGLTIAEEGPDCADPYQISADARRPHTQADMAKVWKARRENSERVRKTKEEFQVMATLDMTVEGRDFAVAADMGDLLLEHGPGVYTAVLLADLEGVQKYYMQPLMQYSIFHEVEAPGGYGPLAGGAQ